MCDLSEADGFEILVSGNGKHCIFHVDQKSESEIVVNLDQIDTSALFENLQKAPVTVGISMRGSTSSDLVLSKIKFLRGLSFEGVQFRKRFSIEDGDFQGEVRFSECKFMEVTSVERCTFKGNFYFSDNHVRDDIHFSDSTFEGATIIVGNEFQRYVSFRGAGLLEYFWSVSNKFLGYFSAIDARFNREAFFHRCLFERVNSFDQATFNRTVSFVDSNFRHAPTFFETSFNERIDVERTIFDDLHSSDAYSSYRSIRERFAKQEMRRSEAQFYFLEQCAATRKLTSSSEKSLAYLYEISSGYGTSLRRPAIALVGFSMLFLSVYTILSWGEGLAVKYLLTQVFSPFGVWTSDNAFVGTVLDTTRAKLIASSQSILTLALLGFEVFALRWRFKNY